MRRADLPSIRLANERVSILLACRLIGMDTTDDTRTKSFKIHCPFGELYHPDGGAERAMRIYPDGNRAYCFVCATGYGPVRLIATAWGLDQADAALALLQRAGIPLPSRIAAWQQALHPPEPTPEGGYLAEALKIFCARVDPAWSTRQFDPDVAARLSACLALLDRVRTEAGARIWLDTCKTVMAQALRLPETTSDVHSG